MKSLIDLLKIVGFGKNSKNILNPTKLASLRINDVMKKIVFVSFLTVTGLFFSACYDDYVSTEPTYEEDVRPASPGELYVWIDGDWIWDRDHHVYTRQRGHWEKPAQGRNYVKGNWQTSSRGYHWTRGHYERQRHQRHD